MHIITSLKLNHNFIITKKEIKKISCTLKMWAERFLILKTKRNTSIF